MKLEKCYETIIGERGDPLSGGRRIVAARIVIRDVPILDEPMTSLDIESETKVQETLDHLISGRPRLSVAYDSRSVARADPVLEGNRIAERKSCGSFAISSSRHRRLLREPKGGRQKARETR